MNIFWFCSFLRKYVTLSVQHNTHHWSWPVVIIFCLLDCVYMFILLLHFMLNVLFIYFSLYVVMSHNCLIVSKLCTNLLQPSWTLSKYVNIYHSWNNIDQFMLFAFSGWVLLAQNIDMTCSSCLQWHLSVCSEYVILLLVLCPLSNVYFHQAISTW